MTPKVRDILQAERDRLGAEILRLQHLVAAFDAVLEEPEANKPDTGTKTCRSLELAPPPAEEEEPLPALVDAATLPPLTQIQFKVFSVFAAAKGEYVSGPQIDDRCGKTGAFGSLSGVVTKGYLVGRPAPGRPRNQMIYHVACFGAPTVLQDSFQHRGKPLAKIVQQQAQPVQQVKAPVAQPAPPPPQIRPPEPPPPATLVTPNGAGAEARKSYPPVTSMRRPAPAPRAPHVPGSNTATQAAFGADGNGGRAALADDGRIKVSTYLIRKGHSVSPAGGGSWRVDGKVMDRYDVLDLINEHREKAELPPAVLQDLE